ncbi:hypothetical protein CPLU01_03837 [Colletotrichum plurivorum]|uniref:Uncharacterized protein n=1 Tax=Colletotrichum plurivorum TaxID=2175906 RepID=A0A8H6KS83_9PEZI|nr:hypothetical protein CPLU01_03837 [Colletotrichum plurivorum]
MSPRLLVAIRPRDVGRDKKQENQPLRVVKHSGWLRGLTTRGGSASNAASNALQAIGGASGFISSEVKSTSPEAEAHVPRCL